MTALKEHGASRVAQTGASSTTYTTLRHGQAATKMPVLTNSASPLGLDDVVTMTYSFHGIRESMDQPATLPDQPLSYQQMIHRWYQTLKKKEAARRAFEAAQQEFDDYASDIVEVIGEPTYSYFLGKYLAALTAATSARQ